MSCPSLQPPPPAPYSGTEADSDGVLSSCCTQMTLDSGSGVHCYSLGSWTFLPPGLSSRWRGHGFRRGNEEESFVPVLPSGCTRTCWWRTQVFFSSAVIKAAWVQTLALIRSGCETWDKFFNFPRPQFLHLEDGMRPHRLPSGVGTTSDNALARDPLDGTYSRNASSHHELQESGRP